MDQRRALRRFRRYAAGGNRRVFVIKRNTGEYLVSAQNLTITGEIEGLRISLVELKPSGEYEKLNYSVDCHTESTQMKVGWKVGKKRTGYY